ncbi:MAG: helix-turn-helix transcriptional regulator [Actinomycetota bacterium]
MNDSTELAQSRIAGLAERGLDLVAFWRECTPLIAKVVPHFQTPCFFTVDPASLLVTSHYQTELPELPEEWLAYEYLHGKENDHHSFAGVAQSKRGVSTIHEATGGDPSTSYSWRNFIAPYGGDQELLVALRDKGGGVWGMVGLYREPSRPMFDDSEINFMRRIAPHLAAGAQRGLLIGEASDPDGPDAPGLLVLRDDWTVESITSGVERWLDELPKSNWLAENALPPSVLAVAGRALRSREDDSDPGDVAFARVLTRGGRWVVLHGASMVGTDSRRVAVIIEPAHPAKIAPMLMSAYQLTEREQEVTRLVLRGDSTSQIAAALYLSSHTVQQHLKTIFEKTGVRSRRDLVGKVFFAFYEPRVRDNEQRVIGGLAVRGGPASSSLLQQP